MRLSIPLLLALALAPTADAQVSEVKRGGGLFGFGFGFNRDTEQISAALFPDSEGTSAASPIPSAASESAPDREGGTIFRYGRPEEVESASYVIRDGRRVPREPDPQPRRVGLFSFGKKKADRSDRRREASDPVPPPEGSRTRDRRDADRAPVDAATRAATASSAGDAGEGRAERKKKKEGGGFFSFLPWKDDEKQRRAPPPTARPVADPVTSPESPAPESRSYYEDPTPTTVTESGADTAGAVQSESETEPRPAPDRAMEDEGSPANPVPDFAGGEETSEDSREQAEEDDGGILSTVTDPIAKLRPSRSDREVDMTGAETIIQNGEIVRNDDASPEPDGTASSSGDGEAKPPRVVDGVKTYSSWEDVEGQSVSTADQILDRIR